MTDEKSVTVAEAQLPAAPAGAFNPATLLDQAIRENLSIDRLEKFMDLAERWNDKQAEDAYVRAMSGFRSEAISITKTKVVQFNETKFSYAPLNKILEAVSPKLAEHGLSHQWTTEQSDSVVKVTCMIRHVDGHSEQTSLSASPDSSGKKNAIQALGSTVSYLERYTFLALTGLAAGNQDDADEPGSSLVSAEQAATIGQLINDSGAGEAAFCNWLNVDSIADIAAKDFTRAVAALKKKAKS